MRRRRPREYTPRRAQSAASTTAWMVTFSDLLTLLLTFFVLRISMGVMDMRAVAELLQQAPSTSRAEDPVVRMNRELLQEFERVLGEPVQATNPTRLVFPGDVSLERRADGAVVSLGSETFLSGSRSISESAQSTLVALGQVITEVPSVYVLIEGHTDNVPIRSEEFPSNWELSAARAISVAHALFETGVEPQRVSAVGYADTKPLASNDAEIGRARNRRVELLLQPQRAIQEGERSVKNGAL